MSVDDVLGVLNQNGEFMVKKAEGGDVLMISFTDHRGQALYDAFNLRFFHYKYVAAYTGQTNDLGSQAKLICYLGQVTPSGGVRPKP